MSARLVIMVLFSLAFEKTDTGILAANAVTLVEFYIPLVIAEFHVCSGRHLKEKSVLLAGCSFLFPLLLVTKLLW